MTKSEVKSLEKRLERIDGVNVWIPGWLSAIGSREELAEWRAISHAYQRQDLYERRVEFIRKMREKYGEAMPDTFEEELERGVEKLKRDKDLRRREGLTEEIEDD